MKVDLITAEIGSTTTVVSVFDGIGDSPKLIAQDEHYTTVDLGDVTIGLEKAIEKIKTKLKTKNLHWEKFYATSSAAGGLKMTVHGLVYDMTVRAAREAALGAGAVLKFVTPGKMTEDDIKKVEEIAPNIIILAGGVDYGESETVIHNAKMLSKSSVNSPIVFAGNKIAAEKVKKILEEAGKEVIITENVYPKVDFLNIEPARRVIQDVFAKHIVKGPKMEKLSGMVDGKIIPTPAAVMITTELLSEIYGDVMTVDIGGATTDVDSVTDGSPEIQKILISPEPRSKRTVEGDLGVFVNARTVASYMKEELKSKFNDLEMLLEKITPYPKNEEIEKLILELARYCFTTAVLRHVGARRYIYGPTGRMDVAEGKDLTAVKYIFGTGGILSRSKHNFEVLSQIKNLAKRFPDKLLPRSDIEFMYDSMYIFAPIGVISLVDKESAIRLLNIDVKGFN